MLSNSLLLAGSMITAAMSSPVAGGSWSSHGSHRDQPRLEKFIELSAATGVQTLSENAVGYLGLIPQIAPAGTFSGNISGSILVGGFLELQYPDTKLGPNAYVKGVFPLNTTNGELVSVTFEGQAELGDLTTRSFELVASATLQTKAQDLLNLNYEAFVLSLTGSQDSNNVGTGNGTIWRLVTPQ